ncbi:MAG: HNH endonuclease [Actinobacteria bacterium]|nr:HNH endonuclease [Actinomycetota bacterium]
MAFEVARERGGSYAGRPAPGPSSSAGAGRALLDRLGDARGTLRAAVDLDLAGVASEVLGEALDEVVRLKRTVAAVEAKVVAAVDRGGVAGAAGAVDTIALLKDRAQLSGREAKRAVQLGRRLERLPGTAGALADGDVGVEQAEQVARAAHTGRLGMPREVEASLLESAKSSTPEELRGEVKRRELAVDGERLLKDERLAYSRRSHRSWQRDDGMHEANYVLDPASFEAVNTMIRAFTTFDPPDTPEELRRTQEQREADALIQAAHVALDAGAAPEQGGEKPHISIVVSADTIAGEPDAPPAEGQWTGSLSNAALYRQLCDAGIARVIAKGPSQLLDVGRVTRVWSGSQRRGIVALDGGCRFPGCDRPAAWTVIHHVSFWRRDRGPTDIANGVLLCVRHHHLCHEGGWALSMDGHSRVVTVVSPDRRTRLTSEPRGIIPRTATTRRRTG